MLKIDKSSVFCFSLSAAKSCDDLYKSGRTTSGVYTIKPDDHEAFNVRCDMETIHGSPGRGWTIFQQRLDGSMDFYRNWSSYKNGFGNLLGEFWLGLDKIHRLSASGQNVLKVDLETFENETAYAMYKPFFVGNESEAYILKTGIYSGNDIVSTSFTRKGRPIVFLLMSLQMSVDSPL